MSQIWDTELWNCHGMCTGKYSNKSYGVSEKTFEVICETSLVLFLLNSLGQEQSFGNTFKPIYPSDKMPFSITFAWEAIMSNLAEATGSREIFGHAVFKYISGLNYSK